MAADPGHGTDQVIPSAVKVEVTAAPPVGVNVSVHVVAAPAATAAAVIA
jgi:hypothetical protein